MKLKILTFITVVVMSTIATGANAGPKWECRDILNPSFVFVTLKQTSNVSENGTHYPAIVTDAFGETHKAYVRKDGLGRIWVWGKGAQGDSEGDEHFQINLKMNGYASLFDFSGVEAGATKDVDYVLRCEPE